MGDDEIRKRALLAGFAWGALVVAIIWTVTRVFLS